MLNPKINTVNLYKHEFCLDIFMCYIYDFALSLSLSFLFCFVNNKLFHLTKYIYVIINY